jgi:TetR/AcrR family transcriptional regulator, transcriptional repressor for nem operon
MIDTRQQILRKNFEAIHLHGFQGTRADKVISELGITKGALYHYFPTKKALGYAVVDELLAPMFIGTWKPIATYNGNPIDYITAKLHDLSASSTDEYIALGCPLNNLMQEMSPLDTGFRNRLQHILSEMQLSLAQGLKRGQKQGIVKKQNDPKQLAFFILSSLEGAYGVAKTMQSKQIFDQSIQTLIDYLDSLKV